MLELLAELLLPAEQRVADARDPMRRAEHLRISALAEIDLVAGLDAGERAAIAVGLELGPDLQQLRDAVVARLRTPDLRRLHVGERADRDVVGQAGRMIDVRVREQHAAPQLGARWAAADVETDVELRQLKAGLHPADGDRFDVVAGERQPHLSRASAAPMLDKSYAR